MTNLSILMLDNNQNFIDSAQEFLKEQESIKEVYTTTSQSKALRLAKEKQPHVILLDVLMPGQNGIALIPALRENAPNAKIIMLTLWDINGYRDSATKAGADGLVGKKHMLETLIPEIEKKLSAIH